MISRGGYNWLAHPTATATETELGEIAVRSKDAENRMHPARVWQGWV
ncbi:hypothetical protein [Roseibium sp.]